MNGSGRWALTVPEIGHLRVQTPYPGTETWLTESRRLTTCDYRLFDVAHAVLPTRLPLERFYSELVRTQSVLAKKHLGVAAAAGASRIIVRHLLHGQTNFLHMLWRFRSVFNEERQLADHWRPVHYALPEPPPPSAEPVERRDLYVHVPVRLSRRATTDITT